MKKNVLRIVFILLFCLQCSQKDPLVYNDTSNKKVVVYQVFTRLFGNTNSTNKPWGTIQDNGVGKFNDFSDKALQEIKALGVTHIWYTGVLHHALVNDYKKFGISDDDPDVVKGRAGSPYAVKDYYNVNPDLAINVTNRLQEFEALIKRTHQHQMKVIIDIIPNHIARKYEGKTNPIGVEDFGLMDDTTLEYHRDNNFYYIINETFTVPLDKLNKPLGGQSHPLLDGLFDEKPAKWTGNGARTAQPSRHDWYETVKINYGVKPDGTKDFDTLPTDYLTKDYKAHAAFWANKQVPNSWKKFKDITLYWLDKGVDGFRFDMAEMVPVEFWSYLNSNIKAKNPEAFLLAEIYNPKAYRDYIKLGKMDYLYDKVDLYDSLKSILKGKGHTRAISDIYHKYSDIEHQLLHFLENHDEQRIASPEFAGSPKKALPAMVVSTLLTSSPTMLYFGQEVGEPGAQKAGFGQPSRTSIFDYVGVPEHQKWMNDGKFDGAKLSKNQKWLRDYYKKLLNLSISENVFVGEYAELQYHNLDNNKKYHPKIYSFLRYLKSDKCIVICNFDDTNKHDVIVEVPQNIIRKFKLKDGSYKLKEMLFNQQKSTLVIKQGKGYITLNIKPLESFVFKF